MELNIANVGMLLTLVSVLTGLLTYNLSKKKEDKQEIKDDTATQMAVKKEIEFLKKEIENLKAKDNPTLEYIKNGIDDIKSEIKDIKADAKEREEKTNDKINSLIEKFARVDESDKSAHKRLTELEQRVNEYERKKGSD